MCKLFIAAIIVLLLIIFPSCGATDVQPSQTVEEIIGFDESWSELDDKRILDPNNGMIYWYHYNDDGEIEINTDEYGNVSVAGMKGVTMNGSR